MAKTELGCQVLQQKGHFSEFAQFIKKHGLEQEDPDIILKLKSILWAVVRPQFFLCVIPALTAINHLRGTLGPRRVGCHFWRKKGSFPRF